MKYNISNNGFRVGDILKPLPGKTQSLYWSLKDVKEVEVVSVQAGCNTIGVKLIDGSSYNREYYNTRYAKSTYKERYGYEPYHNDHELQPFDVNDAHFSLATVKTEDYDIF